MARAPNRESLVIVVPPILASEFFFRGQIFELAVNSVGRGRAEFEIVIGQHFGFFLLGNWVQCVGFVIEKIFFFKRKRFSILVLCICSYWPNRR